MISTIEKLRQRNIPEWTKAPAFTFTETVVKVHTSGYGSAPMTADVPSGDLDAILEGRREVETTLRIRVAGIGRREVSVRVLPSEAGSADGKRSVRMKVHGYGSVPTTMSFARA